MIQRNLYILTDEALGVSPQQLIQNNQGGT